jgi:tetratricopeptide (TPR) repeat protein
MTFVRSTIFVALTVLLGGDALAGTTGEEARAFHDKAKTEFALGKFTQAAEDFERAFELKPDAALLYNAAQAHRLGGNKERALGLYQNYLRVFGRVGKWTEVESRIDELKKTLAEEHAAAAKAPPPPATTKGADPVEPPRAQVQPLAVAPAAKAPASAAPTTSVAPPPSATAPAATSSSIVLVSQPPSAADEPRSLTSRPAFWIVLGVVVAAAATTAIVIATSGSKDPSPSIGSFNAN